jgi:hypothetical protein
LQLSSRAFHPPQLPDLQNAAIPVDIALSIRDKFGSYAASQSPDFCFAYRSLAIVESVIYYDRPIYLAYAVDRSNGLTYARGRLSNDSLDFAANLAGARHFAAPIPELHGITNAVIHEYCFVRGEARETAKFVPVSISAYLGEIDFELRHLADSEIVAANRRLLIEHGWGSSQRLKFKASKYLETLFQDPRWVFERLTVRRVTGSRWAAPMWRWLNRRKVSWTPGGLRLFDSGEEGLAFGIAHMRTQARHLGSMRRRRFTRSSAQEVPVPMESVAAIPDVHPPQPIGSASAPRQMR